MDLLIRDVTFKDSETLLEWRNQPEVRIFSRNQGLILKATHTQWLENRLKLISNEPFWMFENSVQKIGFVRFDFDSALKHYEISIVINPAVRGKGFGKMILNLAIENCMAQNPDLNFFAEAHINNLSSQSLFLNGGFQELELKGEFLAYKRIAYHG